MPIAAFLPAIIGAAGSIGGGLLARKGTGTNSSLLPPGLDMNALKGAIGAQSDFGKFAIGQGEGAIQDPLKFYQGILGGDRTSMMQTLAPEISAINAQYEAPLTEAKLSGRGSSLLPDIESQKQGRISDLMFGLRPQAADKLSGIALNLLGQGSQAQQGVAGNLLDYNAIIRGIQQQGAARSSAMWSSLGGSIGDILSKILTPGGSSGGSGGGWGAFNPGFPGTSLGGP